MRLPNIVTAISDILAGMAIGGSLLALTFGQASTRHISLGEMIWNEKTLNPFYPVLLLIIATIGLYGGGVVLNDVFDAELDKKERPERPIPSGLISKKSAALFGIMLLLIGILAAAFSNRGSLLSSSTYLAVLIAVGAVVYDRWTKHHALFGPLNMGFCRGCNLLLGMSLIPYSLQHLGSLAIVPVVYIAAITMISRDEVHGGKKSPLYLAAAFYLVVILSILYFAWTNKNVEYALPFLTIFAFIIFTPLQQAIISPTGANIGKAVKFGVIGLIAMNAAWAGAFGDLYFAVVIILLLPLSLLLARLFAVT